MLPTFSRMDAFVSPSARDPGAFVRWHRARTLLYTRMHTKAHPRTYTSHLIVGFKPIRWRCLRWGNIVDITHFFLSIFLSLSLSLMRADCFYRRDENCQRCYPKKCEIPSWRSRKHVKDPKAFIYPLPSSRLDSSFVNALMHRETRTKIFMHATRRATRTPRTRFEDRDDLITKTLVRALRVIRLMSAE